MRRRMDRRCPAHDDHRNSLSVHYRDGHWLLYCHAGCEWQDIVQALGLGPKPCSMRSLGEGAHQPFPRIAQPHNRSPRVTQRSKQLRPLRRGKADSGPICGGYLAENPDEAWDDAVAILADGGDYPDAIDLAA